MSVVGVMPEGFAYPDEAEIWGPLAFSPDDLSENSRGGHGLEVLGRMKPGLSLAQVQSDMDRVGKTMIEQHGSYPYKKFGLWNHSASAAGRDRGRCEAIADGADGGSGPGAADRVREYCQPSAGAIDRTAAGDGDPHGAWARVARGWCGNCLRRVLCWLLWAAVVGVAITPWILRGLVRIAAKSLPRAIHTRLTAGRCF